MERDFSDLQALYINCTLKRSPEVSNTQGLADHSIAIMEQNGVQVETIRAIDHDIATGVWPLTYVGKYQGRVAAANILGVPSTACYDAVPRVVFTDPQAAAVGEPDGPLTATVPLAVMEDVIQPFPTFSEAFLHAMQELTARVPVAA